MPQSKIIRLRSCSLC